MSLPAPKCVYTVKVLSCPHCKWRAYWVVRRSDSHLDCPFCKRQANVRPIVKNRR